MITSSNYSADAYVTGANPAPGRPLLVEYPIRSGTQWGVAYTTRSDGGIGLNVYIAGGVGPNGAVAVSQTNATPISLSGVTIGGIIEVTSSQANPVWVTSSGIAVVNLPATQSVFVVNQQSSSLSGTVVVTSSQANPVYVSGTVTVAGITLSGSTPPEAIPNSLDNIEYTRKKQLFDFDSDSVNYVGYAVLGMAAGSSSWTIKRLTFNASGNLEATEWSSTSSAWTNRMSEAYA